MDSVLLDSSAILEGSSRGIARVEVAIAVGYGNPAQFAAAFRKRYGLNPSRLLSPRGRTYSILSAPRPPSFPG